MCPLHKIGLQLLVRKSTASSALQQYNGVAVTARRSLFHRNVGPGGKLLRVWQAKQWTFRYAEIQ
jgi:hypothetical protein